MGYLSFDTTGEAEYNGARYPLPGGVGSGKVGGKTMGEIDKTDLRNRALSIQGHMGAVARMIDEDAYCVDIIKQTQAVQKAIDKLNSLLLERHLGSCVTTAIRSNKPKERERVISELLDVFETTAKL